MILSKYIGLRIVTMIVVISSASTCLGYEFNSSALRNKDGRCVNQSTTLDKSKSINGYIVIRETLCDDVVHSDKIDVYFHQNGGDKKYLLLSYEADSMGNMPSVEWIDSHHIAISVNVVSEIYSRNDHVEGINVTYNFGKIIIRK